MPKHLLSAVTAAIFALSAVDNRLRRAEQNC